MQPNSVTKLIAMIVINSVTLKATAKRELLCNKPASDIHNFPLLRNEACFGKDATWPAEKLILFSFSKNINCMI